MDRKEHWEKVYSEKSSLQVSWYQERPEISLELIEEATCSKDAAIIDVGGGASTLVDCLLQMNYKNVSVLDLSGNALTCAKKRLGAQSSDVHWFEADVTAFVPPQPYDVWHDRAVFHFLTDQKDRRKYVEVLSQSMSEAGHVIIAAFAIGGPERCSGLNIVQYDASKISGELGDSFTLLDERYELHHTPNGGQQKFVYFHFIKKE